MKHRFVTSRDIQSTNRRPPRGRRPSRSEPGFTRGGQGLWGTLIVLLVLVAGVIAVLVFGTIRYGSPAALVQRVRAEVKSYQPHPEWVPAPFATIPTERLTELANSDAGDAPAATVAAGSPVPGTTVAPTATPQPASSDYQPVRPSVQLAGLSHVWQTWNNCGPATLVMNLSYYECKVGQAEAASALRPDKDDSNVSPYELATFARTQNLTSRVMVNGSSERLKLLLSNDVPVLIETWHEPKPNDGMGHYRLLVGYDDAVQQWIAYDSFDAEGIDPKAPYAGIRLPYNTLDALWKVFNRTYVVVYDAERAPAVLAILGKEVDDRVMWQQAVRQAQAEIKSRPGDAFGWFNLGSGFIALRQYQEAAEAFDHARQIGLPWRMLWYQFGPFEAYYSVNRMDEVIALADATLKSANHVEELHYWKGLAYKAKGDMDAAKASLQRAVQLNANYGAARAALAEPSGP